MSIPGSGPISMSMFNKELGRSAAVANTRFANGTAAAVGSIIYLAGESGSNPPDQIAPHSFSEMYGYTADLTTLVYKIELQTAGGTPGSGTCVGTGITYNAQFTDNLPANGVSFSDDAGVTVYKRTTPLGFLNSGSDISFATVQTGVACNN